MLKSAAITIMSAVTLATGPVRISVQASRPILETSGHWIPPTRTGFDDNGFFASIGNTHLFNENWFTNVSFGASSGGFFFPSYRVDAFVNYKVPSNRQFIATVGVGASDARDTDNSDVSLFVGGAYYFQDPWIVQGGVRYNISSPGSVGSTSEFIAITQGRVREHFYTLRYEFWRTGLSGYCQQ